MKKNLLRTLLLAVALLTGTTGAWAEVGDKVTIVDQTFTESTVLKSTDAYTWGSELSGMLKANGLYVTNNSNKGDNYENRDFLTFTDVVGDGTHEVNVSYEVYNPKDKGQANTYYTISYFNNDGDFVFAVQEYSGGWAYGCNIICATESGENETVALSGGHMKKGGGSVVNLTVKFAGETATIEIDGNTYAAYTKSAGIKAVKLSVTGENGYDRDMYIKNYKLGVTEIEAVKVAGYTLKYVVGGVTVKTIEKSGIVGDGISLTAEEKAAFYSEDEQLKYIYVSDDADGKTIANDGSTVVTVNYREAEKFSYILNTSLGTTIAEGEDWEGETLNIAYPRYLVQDGALYTTGKGSAGWYLKTITLDSNGIEETIDYSATETTDVVFLAEAEDIETLTLSSAANSNVRCSNGKCAYNAGDDDAVITTLPNGKYKLYTSAWGSSGTDFTFKAGDNNIFTIGTTGSINDGNSEEFELNAVSTPITLGATDNAGRGIDFVYIVKTGDAELIEVVTPATEVKTIAEMKAVEPGTEVNFVMEGVKVTACGMLGFNGFAALEDATGAIQVGSDMANNVFINLGVSAGMALTGHVKGLYTVVNGVPTFDISENTGAEDELTATEATVEPTEATIAEVKNAESVSKYVILKDVKITVPEDGGMNIYTAAQGEETITVVDNIRDMMTYQTVFAQYMDEETGEVVLPAEFESVTAIVSVDATGAYVLYPTAVVAKEVAEKPATWDFTKWSEETIANLAAEAATIAPDEEGKYPSVTLWRTYEKAGGPTEADPDREGAAYWYGTAISESTGLTANGETIAETDGLLFDKMGAGSLAIAVNYPSTALGTYAGPSYLWIGGKNNSFIIPAVKPGATIEMTVESHKTKEGEADARGVKLTANGTEIGSGIPTTVEDFTWTVPASDAETVDVTVTNTNGCHIYRIYVSDYKTINTGINGINSNVNASVNDVYTINGVKVRAAGESLNGLAKGLYIVGGKKVVIK